MTQPLTVTQTHKFPLQDYEDENYQLPGAGGWFNDQTRPYCGRRSLNRQTRLMHLYGKRNIDATRYKFVCFAVKGKSLLGRLDLRVIWQDVNDRIHHWWVRLANVWQPSHDWQYVCANWDEMLKNKTYSGLKDLKETNPLIEIEDIITPVENSHDYWYHDQFSVTQEEVDLKRSYGAVPSQGWQLLSCSHCQEMGQPADLASDWLFTLVQPIMGARLAH